jgi:hypothetical protein
MAAFLRGKGQLLWDVTIDTSYVHPNTFLVLGSRDMFDTNNKAVDYLFCALCASEFDRVFEKDLACKTWKKLKVAHTGNRQVQAQLFASYRREYENFTLPSESIDTMFQRFKVIVNNMKANVIVLPYDDHDRAVNLLHSLDRTVWSAKVEEIMESSGYETLIVDELFSKLKSFEVDCGLRAKAESLIDWHSLALVSSSCARTNGNPSSEMYSPSSLMSLLD